MVLDVIVTLMVQVSLAASVVRMGLTWVPPTVKTGEKETLPLQVLLKLAEASCMLLRVSLNCTLVSAVVAFRLVMVNNRVVVPPTVICPGTKFLASCGGRSTFRVATGDGDPATGVSAEVAPLVWLVLAPLTLLVICIVTVQLVPAASDGTVRLRLVAPTTRAGLLVVPTQLPPMTVLATVMLVSISVKFTLVTRFTTPYGGMERDGN